MTREDEVGLATLKVVTDLLDRRIAELRSVEDAAGDAYVVVSGVAHVLGAVRNEAEKAVLKMLMEKKK